MRSGRPGPGAGGVPLGGQPIYRLDTDAIRDLRPDLVASQDLCAVCAVPSGHINQALDVLGCQAEVNSLDPSSLDEVLGDGHRIEAASRRPRCPAGRQLVTRSGCLLGGLWPRGPLVAWKPRAAASPSPASPSRPAGGTNHQQTNP
jgi:hypothetical protein